MSLEAARELSIPDLLRVLNENFPHQNASPVFETEVDGVLAVGELVADGVRDRWSRWILMTSLGWNGSRHIGQTRLVKDLVLEVEVRTRPHPTNECGANRTLTGNFQIESPETGGKDIPRLRDRLWFHQRDCFLTHVSRQCRESIISVPNNWALIPNERSVPRNSAEPGTC